MSGKSSDGTGREQQKARTRADLIRAARTIMSSGHAPTVEQVAASASVSRATAYRYFRTRQALLVASYPELVEQSLLGEGPPPDALARLEIVLARITQQLVEHEPVLRTLLRLSLEPRDGAGDELPFRVGRRILWVAEALEPLRQRMPDSERERLVLAIASAVGIDALVWLTDVARLSRPQAVDVMCWSARALLQSALAGEQAAEVALDH